MTAKREEPLPGAVPEGAEEGFWQLDRLSLSYLQWRYHRSGDLREQSDRPILMIHGWLDNALSFCRLAPALSAQCEVFAYDLAGHGHSSHRPPGQGYLLLDNVSDLAEVVHTEFDDRIDLVGHSLGGIVALFFAAAFPERVGRLCLIDSLGPLSKPPEEFVSQMRRAISKRLSGSSNPPVYPDVDSAVVARLEGMIPLPENAARALVPRNLRRLSEVDGNGVSWSTDPRLRHPSLFMMDEAQVLACLSAVSVPTLMIRAEQGLFSGRKGLEQRFSAVPGLNVVTVPGGHHCHLEGGVQQTIDEIRSFLNAEV